ncbi:MAG: 16S rRNA (uracil(1498)-N(3))-methyltransferase [Micavibrio aeruginosavorus]|nr:16S rRNA (uracil(1498)-N(3))-methyltransferase [Micavibrio aeruginosavorus]
MEQNAFFKLPRLYVDSPLVADAAVPLSAEQAHYFKTVLRRQDGDSVRLFNGRDGEWRCTLKDLGKKSGFAVTEEKIRPQPEPSPGIHLYFAPIKKSRMDWLIEKAVELGATHLHPVLTQNTEVREINVKRLRQQVFEAAEQCERLDLPELCDMVKLQSLPADLPILACLERGNASPISTALKSDSVACILIGPEGGFTAAETAWIGQQKNWTPASLGPRILRSETAACMALAAVLLDRS